MEELRHRIALYRGFLEDGFSVHKIEFYLQQICDSEDELSHLGSNGGTAGLTDLIRVIGLAIKKAPPNGENGRAEVSSNQWSRSPQWPRVNRGATPRKPHFFTAAAMLGPAFAKSSGVITGKNSTLALSQRKNGSAIAGM